jgi:hypothetical protein
VLSATAWFLYLGTPDTMSKRAVAKLTRYYAKSGNQNKAILAVILWALAAFLFVWFLSALRSVLRRQRGAENPLSAAIAIGGAVFVALSGAALAVWGSFGSSLSNDTAYRFDANTAILVQNTTYWMMVLAMLGAGIVLFCAWAAARGGALPSWLGWFAIVLAALSIGGPFTSWATPVLFAVWVLAASIVFVRGGRTAPA